jgi:hypothetical protein
MLNKNINKITPSLKGAINQQLIFPFIKEEKRIKKSISKPLKILECWSREELAYSNFQAHEMIYKIYKKLLLVKENLYQSSFGKNKNARIEGKLMVGGLIRQLLEDHKLIDYADIYLAKQSCEDIHRHPHKYHKLEIVSDSYSEFGQFLVDHDEVYKND